MARFHMEHWIAVGVAFLLGLSWACAMRPSGPETAADQWTHVYDACMRSRSVPEPPCIEAANFVLRSSTPELATGTAP